jgi:hypothetical protein
MEESNDCIFITLTNSGYVTYTLNCLESLKKIGFKQPLHSYVIGETGYNLIKEKGYDCTLLNDNLEDSVFQSYKNNKWADITFYKFVIIYENLLKYKFVCFTDGDIVFENKDFLDYLKNNITSYELLTQSHEMSNNDKGVLCSGFMFIRSNENTLEIFNPKNVELYKNNKGNSFDDQMYINEYKEKLKYRILPLELFPNGRYYYKNVNTSPYMIHFNWVIGHEKEKKMKCYGKWYVTFTIDTLAI